MLLGIDSLIVTLGTSTFISGVILWISDSQTISGVSIDLIDWVVVKQLFGIPLAFYYGIALGLVMFYVFEFMPVGRRLLFVGRGRSVARLSGIRVVRLRWGAFVVSGVISAFAGVLYAGTLGSADPTSSLSFLLPAFAAAFLGATTIQPGRFNPIGSIARSTSWSPASPGCSCSASRRSCSSSSTAARSCSRSRSRSWRAGASRRRGLEGLANLVAGVRCSFRGKDAGSADSGSIGATEDAASGRAARPSGSADLR